MPQFNSMRSWQRPSLLARSLPDRFLRIRRQPPPHLRGTARLLRRASSQQMLLHEPSEMERENAAEQFEERETEWAYSRPVIMLDVVWNLTFFVIAGIVLGFSVDESPEVPLGVWVGGYGFQCLVHVLCVGVEYRNRSRSRVGGAGDVEDRSEGSGSEDESADEERDWADRTSFAMYLESANTMFSFIWWITGFYWVNCGGVSLPCDAPQLYWLCITFLAFDVVFVMICVVIASLVGIVVCCCLPCIIAILYSVMDQEGATKEDIDRFPKFKFHILKDSSKANGETQVSFQGMMTESDTDSPTERSLPMEDAECCICLSAYDDGTELRELPCRHHFHSSCIDKWLYINAICPLCKFNILKADQSSDEEA